MARKIIYRVKDIQSVNSYIFNGMSTTDAIKRAGFSDSSMFYLALKRFGYEKAPNKFVKKQIPIVSFL
jgi:methylphosphotriester-DNA--protein-cysteine methyltransferase